MEPVTELARDRKSPAVRRITPVRTYPVRVCRSCAPSRNGWRLSCRSA
jgi:hypothetical protein